ncbi:MAG: TatD family hydrolase [Planctomycetota bacterium]
MLIVDSHAHLDFPEFQKDLPEVIARAKEHNVGYIITVGTDLKSSRRAIELANFYPEVYATIGIHPHEANKITDSDWQEFIKLIHSDKVIAVGEIGLDFYKDLSPRQSQKDIFIKQLNLAKEHKKPVIIHDREAHKECLEILKEVMGSKIQGVAHCFSGSKEIAQEYLNLGMFISVAGPVTYPNAAKLRETVKTIPVESLLLETDCPFLAPQAKRGQRNEPAYLIYHINELAKIYGLSAEDITRITTLNASHLFGLNIVSRCKKSVKTDTEPARLHRSGGSETIAYPIRNSLYLNITNRCTCKCYFCVTRFSDYVKGHNLRLTTEPSLEEILSAIPPDVHIKYKEVVFCGYGEPTLRLDIIKGVCRYLKKKDMHIRINTNGHANIIANKSVPPELKGLVDSVSVSLNALTPKEYKEICQPQFGEQTFNKVIEFIKEAKESLPYVEITTVMRPDIDIKPFQKLAEDLGVDFRARIYNEIG